MLSLPKPKQKALQVAWVDRLAHDFFCFLIAKMQILILLQNFFQISGNDVPCNNGPRRKYFLAT